MQDNGDQLKTIQEFRQFLREHYKAKHSKDGRIGVYLSKKELERLIKLLEEPDD